MFPWSPRQNVLNEILVNKTVVLCKISEEFEN